MKRLLLTLALVIALTLGGSPVLAQDSDGVTVTAEPAYLGIEVSPEAYDFGLIEEGEAYTTKGGHFTAVNTGSVICDLSISGVDMTGDNTTWILDSGGVPADSTYAMKCDIGEGFNIVINPTGSTMTEELLRHTSQPFDLQLLVPTANVGLDLMTGYVTVTAEEAATVTWSQEDTTGGIVVVDDCWREGVTKLWVDWNVGDLAGGQYSMIVTANGNPLYNPAAPSVGTDQQVGLGTDDALRGLVPSFWALNDPANIAGNIGGGVSDQVGSGMRFANVTVPQGVTITNAYLTFTAIIQATGTVNTYISAEDVDNASTFIDDSAVFDARYANHTALVAFDNIPVWEPDILYQSPDISSVIQAIVNRPGWTSGNGLAIFWEDFDGRSAVDAARRAHSYESDPAKAIQLTIEYVPDVWISGVGLAHEVSYWEGDVSGAPVILITTALLP